MFPAPRGLVALFKHEMGGKVHHTDKPVVAFDEDGRPYVVPETGARLIPAESIRNYDGMGEDPYPPIVSLIPAGGWRVEYTGDTGTWSEPLAGWGLRANGDVVPLETDSTGLVDTSDSGNFRIYHPEQTPEDPATTKETD